MADQDPMCYGNGNSTPLYDHLMSVARQLPILGNPQASQIQYLFHFSNDSNIQAFSARPMEYCWADVISANIAIIDAITNAPRASQYTTIYVLRVGLGNNQDLSQSPVVGYSVQGKPGRCMEYGLAIPVNAGDFGRVPIFLDPTGAFFLG